VEEPEALRGKERYEGATPVVPKDIVDAYYDYMGGKVDSWGDSVYLGGSPLEASQYEMVHLTLQADPDTDRFVIIYTLDATDKWARSAAFIQGFCIIRSGDTAQPAPASNRVRGRHGLAARLRRIFAAPSQTRD
jgi:hypothetical protein